MIKVRLREMIDAFQARTGERLTYGQLAERAQLSKATVESLATRGSYNSTLGSIERICRALGCTPGELLVLDDDSVSAPPCQ